MLSFGAISESAISAVPDALRGTFAGIVTYAATESDNVSIYAASEEYISLLSDTPAGQPFRGTLDKLPQFTRSIMGNGFDGLANSWGDFQLINDGLYDNLIGSYAVDGRPINFYAGDPSTAFASFFPVANVVATTLTVDTQVVTVSVEDKSFKLTVPTQPNVYQGTGDLEGGTDLTAKRKPLCFGRVKNATPALVISAELVFQINDGAVSAISAVYDKGYPLTATSDYATPALLRAATIADGSYATCVAYGLFRLGGAAQQATCDCNGDATNSGYVETTGTIIRRIVALTGCISDPTDVDTVSFANLETVQPAPIGYYLDPNSSETVAQTFDKLAKGIGAFCGFTRLGLLQCGVFTAPSGASAASFADVDIIGEIGVEKLPSAFDPPPWRIFVPYDLNWTVISDPVAGVATADADRAAWIRGPYRTVVTSATTGLTIKANHLLAQDPGVRTCFFALSTDAQTEANRLLTLANSNYRLYRILLKTHPFTLDLIQCVTITDELARLGFSAGKQLRIASISDIPNDNTVELRAVG